MKTMLLGLHDSINRGLLASIARRSFGYSVDEVASSDQMTGKSREKEYDVTIMDLNLGHPGSSDITPAREVWGIVQQRVKDGLAKFLGVSGSYDAFEQARREQIPCERKPFDFPGWFEKIAE